MRIGVDLGGTKTEVVVLNDDGTELFRHRRPSDPTYDGTIAVIAGLIAEAEAAVKQRCVVGIGIPGAISPATGLVKNANSTWLIGQPLDKDLAAALERPLRIANDANCFAVSEATDGAAAGAHCVFGVIVGTGCGGGVVIDGKPIIGANAIGGEWGHCELPWMTEDERPGPDCYCGKNGCLETFISGTGLAKDHIRAGNPAAATADIAAAAAAGDDASRQTIARHEDRMARGLAVVINVLDPDVIVLGGGISNLKSLYRNLPKLLGKYVFSDHVDTPIVPPVHGDSSGVRGAAQLWPAGAAL